MTQQRALQDFERGQRHLQDLVAQSPEVKNLVDAGGVIYELVDDDGYESTLIGSKKGDSIRWAHRVWERRPD
jgi:hypothetical protein